MRKVKLGHLPEDLLAHVLRFTTSSLRRDGRPGRPASVLHLRFAAISPAFRRAFLRHLEAVVFDHPACRRLAELNWGALRSCIALRKIVVARSSRLNDDHLVSMFRLLANRGVFLRDVELALSEELTAVSLTSLVEHFGEYLTRLRVVLVANPRAARRLQIAHAPPEVLQALVADAQDDLNVFADPHPVAPEPVPPQLFNPQAGNQLPPPPVFAGAVHVAPHINIQPVNLPQGIAPPLIHHQVPPHLFGAGPVIVQPNNPQAANPPPPDAEPNNPDDAVGDPDDGAVAQADGAMAIGGHFMFAQLHGNPAPVPQWHQVPAAVGVQLPVVPAPDLNMAGVLHQAGGPLVQAFHNVVQHVPFDQAVARTAEIANGAGASMGTSNVQTGDDVPIPSSSNDSENATLDRFAKELNTHREFARNFIDLLGDLTSRANEPNVNMVAPGEMNECIVTDPIFNSLFSSLPNLVDLTLVRLRSVGPEAIGTLLRCPKLQKLQLSNMPRVTSDSLGDVLKKLTNLRELCLSKMVVEDKAMADLVHGASGSKFETLKLVLMDRITDQTIRLMVNKCQALSSVNFMMCSKITNSAASHIACAANVKSVMLSPYDSTPVSSRAVVHLSCARVLRSLSLGNCKRLGVDGINALANLPGLTKLHLTGLGGLSLDVMKALGGFPRLDDLLLQGQLGLTDLGVKLLCGLRGHRFIHLILADSTKSMCEDGLDHIMTWCNSLRTLEVYGNFKEGVLDRLHDSIPHADVRVNALVEKNGGFIEGDRSVWD